MQVKPVLFVDIDSDISPWGLHSNARPVGAFHGIERVTRCLSCAAGIHLLALHERFALWYSGPEEKAEEYLPREPGLPRGVQFLSFARNPGRAQGHCKLAATDVATAAP